MIDGFIRSQIKKGKNRGRTCHAKNYDEWENQSDSEINTKHVTPRLSQITEEKVRGKGLEEV